jgi:hypothetical protein
MTTLLVPGIQIVQFSSYTTLGRGKMGEIAEGGGEMIAEVADGPAFFARLTHIADQCFMQSERDDWLAVGTIAGLADPNLTMVDLMGSSCRSRS